MDEIERALLECYEDLRADMFRFEREITTLSRSLEESEEGKKARLIFYADNSTRKDLSSSVYSGLLFSYRRGIELIHVFLIL